MEFIDASCTRTRPVKREVYYQCSSWRMRYSKCGRFLTRLHAYIKSVYLIAHGLHFKTVVKYLTSCGLSSNVLALSMKQSYKLFLLYRFPESLTYRNSNKNMTRYCIKQEHIDKSVNSHLIYNKKLCNAPAMLLLKVVLLTLLYIADSLWEIAHKFQRSLPNWLYSLSILLKQ
jgi:hypothetical protein